MRTWCLFWRNAPDGIRTPVDCQRAYWCWMDHAVGAARRADSPSSRYVGEKRRHLARMRRHASRDSQWTGAPGNRTLQTSPPVNRVTLGRATVGPALQRSCSRLGGLAHPPAVTLLPTHQGSRLIPAASRSNRLLESPAHRRVAPGMSARG